MQKKILCIFSILFLSHVLLARGEQTERAPNAPENFNEEVSSEDSQQLTEPTVAEEEAEQTPSSNETEVSSEETPETFNQSAANSNLPQGEADAKIIDFSADEVSSSLAEGKELTSLKGNVFVRVNNQRMIARELQIYGENYTILTGLGQVKINDNVKKIYIEGNNFTYDRVNKILRIRGEISIEDQDNEVIVRAAYLEYFEDEEILNLQVNVRVFNKDITTRSEVATYKREEQLLELSGSPVVNKGEDRYESTLITVDLDTREVSLEGGASGVIETE